MIGSKLDSVQVMLDARSDFVEAMLDVSAENAKVQ